MIFDDLKVIEIILKIINIELSYCWTISIIEVLSLYIVVDNYTDGESVESYQSSPVCPDGRL